MRTIIYLALLTGVIANPISLPLYKRTDNGGIFKAPGKALDSGVLAGKVKIGKPAQEFTFAFDTTTGYSWVRGSRCKTENCRNRCSYYATQSSKAISTGQKFSVDYGDSCVDTHIYMDTFEFAGLKVKDMVFGGAYRMKGFGDGFDGYLGLGRSVNFSLPNAISTSSASLSKRAIELPPSAFVPAAFQQTNGMASGSFGIYTTGPSTNFDPSGFTSAPVALDPNGQPVLDSNGQPIPANVTSGGFGFVKRHNTEEEPAGYLVLGGIDKSIIKGKVEYLRLAQTRDGSEKNWDVCIRHAGFGPLRLEQQENAIASISTSTSFISMPPQQADLFQKKFGGVYLPDTKNYAFKCSEAVNLPMLKMTLEDHIVEMPAAYWLSVIDADKDECVTKITRGNSEIDWVLGTSFVNAFYSTFDPELDTVGLAIKKGQKKDGLRVYRKSH